MANMRGAPGTRPLRPLARRWPSAVSAFPRTAGQSPAAFAARSWYHHRGAPFGISDGWCDQIMQSQDRRSMARMRGAPGALAPPAPGGAAMAAAAGTVSIAAQPSPAFAATRRAPPAPVRARGRGELTRAAPHVNPTGSPRPTPSGSRSWCFTAAQRTWRAGAASRSNGQMLRLQSEFFSRRSPPATGPSCT